MLNRKLKVPAPALPYFEKGTSKPLKTHSKKETV